MVEIKYQPYKELIIHEIKKVELKDLLGFVAGQAEAQRQGAAPVVEWIDGIAFTRSSYPIPAPAKVIEDELEGRLHYPFVIFAETSYEPQKRTTLNGREVSVAVHKAEDNPVYQDLAKFLKEFKP